MKQIKTALQKSKRLTDSGLKETVLRINNHIQTQDQGSAMGRFLRRRPRSMLPNSISREIDLRGLLGLDTKVRKNWQHKKDVNAEIGDEVVIQNPATRKWTIN